MSKKETKFSLIYDETVERENMQKKLECAFNDEHARFAKEVTRKGIWINKGIRERTIGTPFGDIKIIRYIYKNKYTGKERILFDRYLGLKPRIHWQEKFWLHAYTKLLKVRSYVDLTELFGLSFSTAKVTEIVDKININYIPTKISEMQNKVFVNADGVWLPTHKGKKCEHKFAICYTGVKRKGKRNILVNKVLIPFKKGISTEEMASALEDYIEFIYGKVMQVHVVGDGARWIRNMAYMMKRTTYSIDKFHYLKWIKTLIGKRTKFDKTIVYQLDEKELKEYLLTLSGSAVVNIDTGQTYYNLDKAKRKLLNQILRFKDDYNFTVNNNLINVAECTQSHHICSFFKTRRYFSHKVKEKLLVLSAATFNGWQITDDPEAGMKFKEILNPHGTISKSNRIDKATNLPNIYHPNANTAKAFYSFTNG